MLPACKTKALDADVGRAGRSKQGRYVDYEVPRQTSQTVLDVVTYIQRKLDLTLAYRYACRVGCAVRVR